MRHTSTSQVHWPPSLQNTPRPGRTPMSLPFGSIHRDRPAPPRARSMSTPACSGPPSSTLNLCSAFRRRTYSFQRLSSTSPTASATRFLSRCRSGRPPSSTPIAPRLLWFSNSSRNINRACFSAYRRSMPVCCTIELTPLTRDRPACAFAYPPARPLHLLRPRRRHGQGERDLGVAVRGRGGARHASCHPRSGGRAGGGRRRAPQTEGIRGAQRRSGGRAPRRESQGARQEARRNVEISALDCGDRCPSEDGDWQDSTL